MYKDMHKARDDNS